MKAELQRIFDQEVEEIKSNPWIAGNWGLYLDYLRTFLACGDKCNSTHFRQSEDGTTVEVSVHRQGEQAYMTVRKLAEVLSAPLPQELQLLLMHSEE
jgi:hypothetical protein